jgi:hypothetical protein
MSCGASIVLVQVKPHLSFGGVSAGNRPILRFIDETVTAAEVASLGRPIIIV